MLMTLARFAFAIPTVAAPLLGWPTACGSYQCNDKPGVAMSRLGAELRELSVI